MNKALWSEHPGVRSGRELTMKERAADLLKDAMGTWSALGVVILAIGLWMALVQDPGHLMLNLALSLIAAVQGIVLQISANRGDRTASELAMHDHQMLQRICDHLGIPTLQDLGEDDT